MKRFFVITYFVHFVSDKNSQHDRFERFYFWQTPQFFDWIVKARKEKEIEQNCNLVITNCGKF